MSQVIVFLSSTKETWIEALTPILAPAQLLPALESKFEDGDSLHLSVSLVLSLCACVCLT